ncbi:MAG: WYL domain-containing protein [Bacteroidales bacterium]
MATNKNAVLRYNTLDKCFSNFGRKYYFQDLLDKVNEVLEEFDPRSAGIKTRQLRDDMRFMKSEAGYSAPILAYKDGKKAYYRYEDRDYSINNSPLNSTEAEQLRNAISILQRFEGAPQFEWINEIGPMLSNQFGLNNAERKIISYDSNIDYTGYDKIQPLFNAIVNKRVLKIHYKSFRDEDYDLIFHPYYLKQFNNRWFVFGLHDEFNNPCWNLPLDRIMNIDEIDSQYIDTVIDWEDHFYDIIGVTKPQDRTVEEVDLIFTEEQAKYVSTKPLHPSQRSRMLDSGELQVKLKIIPNYEFEMIILSFGEKVKIIKPDYVREQIIVRNKNTLTNYS